MSRASTFKEEFHLQSSSDSVENAVATNDSSHPPHPAASSSSSSSSSSLAAQAIKASAGRRDPSLSFSFSKSSFAPDHHQRSKSFDTYGDALGRGDSKSGFWGVLAQKAKEILDEDNSYPQRDIIPERLRSHSFNTFATPGARAQEGKTGDQRTQIKLNPQTSGMWNPWQQPGQTVNPQTIRETQLKASRDVAMATAAKAKLLLRELKTVKADLAFAKARCAQLEEENKLLRDREGREKGHNRADDDLIRLQLETLLAEKARLANENEIHSRENRFLREIVEYHQLTMQDVVYLDEGMEEVAELYPIDSTGMLSMSPHSPFGSRVVQSKSMFPVPQDQEEEEEEDKNTSEDEAPPASISISKDKHAK